MKKLLVATALCSYAMLGTVSAQKCANDILLHQKLASDPGFQVKYDDYANEIMRQTEEYEQIIATTAQKTTASPVLLPVVFHVILTQAQLDMVGGMDGIYDRVVTQISVLNRDFNARNSDSSKIPAAFKSLYGNPMLSFGAAHTDPNGKSTSGVELKIAPPGFPGYQPNSNDAKYASLGGLDPWDNKKYINIWIVNMVDGNGDPSNVLGYGYSPNYAKALTVPEEAGIVLALGAFGTKTQKSTYFFSNGVTGGRTLVHEMGHFFNLWHVWGNTNIGSGVCSDDDGVSDTPRQLDANQSCLTGVKPNCTNGSVPGGEMYMNYMDYTGDACTIMFSKGQVKRIHAQFMLDSISNELAKSWYLTMYPTSVAGIERETGVEVYPNPSAGKVNVHIANNATIQSISIINIMGQSIRQINTENSVNEYNFDLSGMPAGVYTVQCRFEEGIVTRKIVLQ